MLFHASKKDATKKKKNKKQQEKTSSLEITPAGKNVCDLLGYECMFENGLCRIEQGRYSAMYAFEDVSYQDRRYEEQFEVFSTYAEFLNSIDSDLDVQLLFNNRLVNGKDIKTSMCLAYSDDPNQELENEYRREINTMIEKQVLSKTKSIERERYLILSTTAANKDEAEATLFRAGEAAIRKFEDMGSDMHFCSASERLSVCARILRPADDTSAASFSYEDLHANPTLCTKDFIAPACLDKIDAQTFQFGDYYGSVLSITKYARSVKDDILAAFSALPQNLVMSMHVRIIDQADAIDLVDSQLTDMKAEKSHHMIKHGQRFFYTEEMLPSNLKDGIKNAEALHSDIMNKDQKMFIQTLLFFTFARSLDELKHAREELERVARSYRYKIDPVFHMQRARGLKSILPLGVCAIPHERVLTTAPLAAFCPFISEELMQPGGAYYGWNQLSKNPIFFKRSSLAAANGMIVGKPGRGKSFAAKQEMTNTLLTERDASVDIIDPEREFSALARGFSGEIIHISSASKNYLNPFDISEDYSDDDDPLTVKTDFILSLVKEMAGGLSAIQESIVDRVCRIIYQPYFTSGKADDLPILSDFHKELLAQPEEDAHILAVTIERYITGSYSVFNHHTNIDASNHLRIWDLKDLGKQMRTVALLVVLDQVWNQIVKNRDQGVRSYFYTDEWQLLLKNDYAVNFYDELWSRARKWGAVPTAITQNIARVVQNEKARLMLSNSDFMLLLEQSTADADILRELLHLSDTQMRHIASKRKGAGLLVAGSKIVPFVNEFPQDTKLYQMFTTKFEDICDALAR